MAAEVETGEPGETGERVADGGAGSGVASSPGSPAGDSRQGGAGGRPVVEIRLASRPDGVPGSENFARGETTLSPPGAGEVELRTLWLSVDPYMRGRMRDVRSYVPPFALDAPLAGGGIAEIVQSNDPSFSPGDLVIGNLRWRTYDVVPARHLEALRPEGVGPEKYLGVLGMPGMTAYVGLLDIGKAREGDVVLVSGAAGAVGSAAGQIAKQRGCRVIGTAGGPAKVAYLERLGFDAAIDYRATSDLGRAIRDAAPDGIDVYFDNVGGAHLEAALWAMRDFGRVVLCGAISSYNDTAPSPGPTNLSLAIGRRLRLEGFIVSDHAERRPAFLADMEAWVRAGKVHADETVVEGLEGAPDAFVGLFRGDNVGKMLVRVAS